MPDTIYLIDVTDQSGKILGCTFEELPLSLIGGRTYQVQNNTNATVGIQFGTDIISPNEFTLGPSGRQEIDVGDGSTPVPYTITRVWPDESMAMRTWTPPAIGPGGNARVEIVVNP